MIPGTNSSKPLKKPPATTPRNAFAELRRFKMKKTFTANLNGTVFHIEEDAYDQLQRYRANIRAKFSGSAEAEEIMADIEARIAELFTERLQGRQAVSLADVDHVKQVMGQPEDYVDDETGTGGSSAGERSYQHSGSRLSLIHISEPTRPY